jgi:hypothetical protein
MALTLDQLRKHLKPQPPMSDGFARCSFDLRLLTVADAIECLTCWDCGASTVKSYVAAKGVQALPDSERIQGYARDFHDGPVVVIAFTLGTLGTIWPSAYPGGTGDRLVIWDGNHRVSALAVRAGEGKHDDHPVVAFVGQV